MSVENVQLKYMWVTILIWTVTLWVFVCTNGIIIPISMTRWVFVFTKGIIIYISDYEERFSFIIDFWQLMPMTSGELDFSPKWTEEKERYAAFGDNMHGAQYPGEDPFSSIPLVCIRNSTKFIVSVLFPYYQAWSFKVCPSLNWYTLQHWQCHWLMDSKEGWQNFTSSVG